MSFYSVCLFRLDLFDNPECYCSCQPARWSPALQLLHGGTLVAGGDQVHLPADTVFGHQGVKRVWQQADGKREEFEPGHLLCLCSVKEGSLTVDSPDDQVVVFEQRVQVSFLTADIHHDGDGVGVSGRQLLSLLQHHRAWRAHRDPQSSTTTTAALSPGTTHWPL